MSFQYRFIISLSTTCTNLGDVFV